MEESGQRSALRPLSQAILQGVPGSKEDNVLQVPQEVQDYFRDCDQVAEGQHAGAVQTAARERGCKVLDRGWRATRSAEREGCFDKERGEAGAAVAAGISLK